MIFAAVFIPVCIFALFAPVAVGSVMQALTGAMPHISGRARAPCIFHRLLHFGRE